MIVGGGKKQLKKAAKDKQKSSSGRNRAADKLKQAIAQGTLDDLLWGAAEIEKTHQQVQKIQKQKKKSDEELEEERRKQEDEDILDEIRDEYNQKIMWNELLTDHKITHRYEFALKHNTGMDKQRHMYGAATSDVRSPPRTASSVESTAAPSNNNMEQHVVDDNERPLSSPSKLQSLQSPATPISGRRSRRRSSNRPHSRTDSESDIEEEHRLMSSDSEEASFASSKGDNNRRSRRRKRKSKRHNPTNSDEGSQHDSPSSGLELDRTPRGPGHRHLPVTRRQSKMQSEKGEKHSTAAPSDRSPRADEEEIIRVKSPPVNLRSRFSKIMSGTKPTTAPTTNFEKQRTKESNKIPVDLILDSAAEEEESDNFSVSSNQFRRTPTGRGDSLFNEQYRSASFRWGGISSARRGTDGSLSPGLFNSPGRRMIGSADVVSELFQMSNELRQERENIMSHATDAQGQSAFINREATMKYNEELDEVAQSKQQAKHATRKAAVLTMKKNAQQFKVNRGSNDKDFAQFWIQILAGNSRFMSRTNRKYARFGLDAADAADSTSTEQVELLQKLENPDGKESEAAADETEQLDVEEPEKEGGIASLLATNLSMLYTTKRRASELTSDSVSRRQSVKRSVSSISRRSPKARHSRRHNSRKQHASGTHSPLDDSEDEDGVSVISRLSEESEDDDDSQSVDSFVSDNMRESNQRNLSAIVDRMRAAGVMSEKMMKLYGMKLKPPEQEMEDTEQNKEEPEIAGDEADRHDNDTVKAQEKFEVATDAHNQIVTAEQDDTLDNFLPVDHYGGNNESVNYGVGVDLGREKLSSDGQVVKRKTALRQTLLVDAELDQVSISEQMEEAFVDKPCAIQETSVGYVLSRHRPQLIDSPLAPQSDPESHTLYLARGGARSPYSHENAVPEAGVEVSAAASIYCRSRGNSLAGKWHYDAGLEQQQIYGVSRGGEQATLPWRKFWARRSRASHKSSAAIPSSLRKVGRSRVPYPLNTQRSCHITEVTFSPDLLCLILTELSAEDQSIISYRAVHINSVFITESAIPDMITLRSNDPISHNTEDFFDGGYLGSYSYAQWVSIEEEINQSLVHYAHNRRKSKELSQRHVRSSTQLQGKIWNEVQQHDHQMNLRRLQGRTINRASSLDEKRDITSMVGQHGESHAVKPFNNIIAATESAESHVMTPSHSFLEGIRPEYNARMSELTADALIGNTDDEKENITFPLTQSHQQDDNIGINRKVTFNAMDDVYHNQPFARNYEDEFHSTSQYPRRGIPLSKRIPLLLMNTMSTAQRLHLEMPSESKAVIRQQSPNSKSNVTDLAVQPEVVVESRFKNLISGALTYCSAGAEEGEIPLPAGSPSKTYRDQLQLKFGVEIGASKEPVAKAKKHGVKSDVEVRQQISLDETRQYWLNHDTRAFLHSSGAYYAEGHAAYGQPVRLGLLGTEPPIEAAPQQIFTPTKPRKPKPLVRRSRSFAVDSKKQDVTPAPLTPSYGSLKNMPLRAMPIVKRVDIDRSIGFDDVITPAASPLPAATLDDVTGESEQSVGLPPQPVYPAQKVATITQSDLRRSSGFAILSGATRARRFPTIATTQHLPGDPIELKCDIEGDDDTRGIEKLPSRPQTGKPSKPPSRSTLESADTEAVEAAEVEKVSDETSVTKKAISAAEKEKLFEFQIVILIESRRIMQLYFAKKFLQLDMVMNVHRRASNCSKSIAENPAAYGLIFINFAELTKNGVTTTLQQLLPPGVDRAMYSIIVYDVGDPSDDILMEFEENGVSDILSEPYSLTNIKTMVDAHRRKQYLRMDLRSLDDESL